MYAKLNAMSKPGPISAKPLSALLGGVFSDAYAKQGFASRELVTRWVEIAGAGVRQWFDTLCHAGMPHHPVLLKGHHRESLRRLARMLGMVWLEKHDD